MNLEPVITHLVKKLQANGAKSTVEQLREDARYGLTKIVKTCVDKYNMFAYAQSATPSTTLSIGDVFREGADFVANVHVTGVQRPVAVLRFTE